MLRTFCVLCILALAAMVTACSGGDDDGAAGLPEGIPTFTGAEPDPDTTFAEGDAFTGTWRTTEDVPAVREFFTRELQEGPWRITDTREVADGVVIVVEDAEDPSRTGTIIIRREGGSTRIAKTISGSDDDDDDDDGDGNNSSDPGDVVTGRLPDGYPDDVPLPDDSEVVSGSAPVADGSQYFLVEFTSDQPPSGVMAFFNQELPAQGWDAGEGNDNPAGFILNFVRGADTVTVTGGNADAGTSATITITIPE